MLLQEVRSTNVSKYQQVVFRKAVITKEIRKKKVSNHQLEQLTKEILPEQGNFISYYVERIPRIERIINILRRGRRGQHRIKRIINIFRIRRRGVDKEREDQYKNLIKILNGIIKLGRENLLSLIENQEFALKEGNFRNYLNLVRKEHIAFSKVLNPLKKLNIRIDPKSFHLHSINWKKLAIIEISVVLLYLSIITPVIASEYSSGDVKPEVAKLAEEVKECAYQYGIELPNTGEFINLDTLFYAPWKRDDIKHFGYYINDLEHELPLETEFESLTKVNIFGEYTARDLELTKYFFENTYGYDIKKNSQVIDIVFLSPGTKFKGVDPNNPKCTTYLLGMISDLGVQMNLISSGDHSSSINFLGTLAHEYAHQIHGYVARLYPEFNKEWDKINGGFARQYGKTNRNEDVATVVQAVMIAFFEGKDINITKTIDGNYEALHAKLKLLEKYHFFPPSFKFR